MKIILLMLNNVTIRYSNAKMITALLKIYKRIKSSIKIFANLSLRNAYGVIITILGDKLSSTKFYVI